MKIPFKIGIILMVSGMFLAVYGYELCAHYFCLGIHCQSCQTAEPISNLTISTGIAVMLGGVAFLVYYQKK